MVKNNLLLYRSYDAVARDMPAEAFGDDNETVYMLHPLLHTWSLRGACWRQDSWL